jgi:hypothetical protein
MSICIVGCFGNMGLRYGAILAHLGIDWVGSDYADKSPPVADNYIVATPTRSHAEVIIEIKLNAPDSRILCEKPISKKVTDFNALDKWADTIFMVNNYAYLANPKSYGQTYYNYYNTGSDGINWDCIQLYHLSYGRYLVENNSPLWKCEINGWPIARDEIDTSYVLMVKDFLSDTPEKLWSLRDVKKTHEEIARMEGLI